MPRRMLALQTAFALAALLGYALVLANIRGQRTLYFLSHQILAAAPAPAPRPDPRIVLVRLDDDTLADPEIPHWGPTVLARRAHAKVVRELTAAGARVIGFDVAFIGESTRKDDGELARALDDPRTPSVVLVVGARANEADTSSSRFIEPPPALAGAAGVRLSSPVVVREALSAQVLGVRMEQPYPDGRTLNALAFECYKAGRRLDDLSASFTYAIVDEHGTMKVRWPRPPLEGAFSTVSYRDVWNGSWRSRGAGLFKDQIVLIGSFATLGHTDVLKTPFGETPGVVVHACALQTLLDRAAPRGLAPWWTLCLAVAAGIMAILSAYRLRPLAAFAALVALIAGIWVLAFGLYRAGTWIGPVEPTLAVAWFGFVGFLASSSFARGIIARYAGKQVAEQLATTGSIRAGGQTATVFFADVRGYTSLSETLSPAELMAVLNEHFRWMDGIVERHGGRVDKHIGDAMMAVFEGTRGGRNHAERALAAASEMVRDAGKRRGAAAEITFGIGIHTGDIFTAELGSAKQEVGTVGDAVNVAARLEQSTRTVGVTVLASEDVVREAGREAELRPLEPLALKGKSEPVAVYTLPDLAG